MGWAVFAMGLGLILWAFRRPPVLTDSWDAVAIGSGSLAVGLGAVMVATV